VEAAPRRLLRNCGLLRGEAARVSAGEAMHRHQVAPWVRRSDTIQTVIKVTGEGSLDVSKAIAARSKAKSKPTRAPGRAS
jgi:hypothetical protein